MRLACITICLLATISVTPSECGEVTSHGPLGRWDGVIQLPSGQLRIEIELHCGGDRMEGTLTAPDGRKAYRVPLSRIVVEHPRLSFVLNLDGESALFVASVVRDGQWMAGDVSQSANGFLRRLSTSAPARIPTLDNTRMRGQLERLYRFHLGRSIDFSGKAAETTPTRNSIDKGC